MAEEKKPGRWIRWYRPSSYWEVAVPHLLLGAVTGIPILASYILPLDSLPSIPCTFLRLTGYPCPFCGFTRSFWALSEGNWSYAIMNTPLSIVLYLLFIGIFIVNIMALIKGIRVSRGDFLRFNRRKTKWVLTVIFLLVLMNWIYRLSLGLK